MLVLAVVVIVYWWSYRSFPPGETARLIERLGEVSQRTETRLDDLLVEIARLLNELRTAGKQRPRGQLDAEVQESPSA